MTKATRVRLCLALFVLAVIAGVVGVTSAPEAYAIPCCQTCDAQVAACRNDPANPCAGNYFCCLNQSSFCYNHCTRC